MKLLLTLLLAFTASASEPNFWPNRLDGLLENGLNSEIASHKLTAMYVSANWCTPCKSFTPRLLEFRNRYSERFQFVVLSRERLDRSQNLSENRIEAPTVSVQKHQRNSLFENELQGVGISQLLVFGADGTLITRNGRALLENKQDPGKPRNWGNRQAQGYAEWESLLIDWHHLGGTQEKTPEAYLQKLELKYGSTAFWPVYKALLRNPKKAGVNLSPAVSGAEERKTLMEQAAASVVKHKNWDEIWAAAELLSEGNLEDGGPDHRIDHAASHFFYSVGKLAAGDGSFAEACNQINRRNTVVHSAMLRSLAAAAATGKNYLDEALFWLEARDYIHVRKNYRILEPLLLAGNPRAYQLMADAAQKKALYHLVKAPLENAAQAGRHEPMVILHQLESLR